MSQLLLAASALLVVAIAAIVLPEMLGKTLFFVSVVLVLVTTALAGAVPWARLPAVWIILIPALDIIAIVFMRQAQPLLGSSFLLIFPVIWLAGNLGKAGAIGGVLTSTVLLWGMAGVSGTLLAPTEVPRLAVVPIVLTFVAFTVHATTRRAAAQRVLLTQQAGLFELALHRSRRQENLLDEILNAVDFGVINFDRNGRPYLINRAQREILARFGSFEDYAVPATVYREDKVTEYPDDERPFRRALRGETIDRLTVWVGNPDNDRAAFLVSTRPLYDQLGDFDGCVMVLRDVTPEMQAIQARDDLVSSVSHELRTPLTSVLGYLELALDDERLDPSTRQMLTVAGKNADRLLALVSELLTAATDRNASVFVLTIETCNLATIVGDALEAIQPLAHEREIEFDVLALQPVFAQADAFRLRQVVDNLLSNAVKYNVHAGRISVAVFESGGQAELQISDTGRGMTVAEQKRLFEPFYRADSVRGSSVHGTGLGLSLSRDIVRQHGGELRLISEAGQGTTAIATIPLTQAPSSQSTDVEAPSAHSGTLTTQGNN